MRFFDLFCGIGGFRLGLERAGHECIGSCEIEKNARAIYGKNFGAEPEYADALRLDARTLPDFDILTAGFPCQAFSLAGKRLGFADTRGTLFFEIARIARQKRPQYLLLENVKGLLSHDEGRTFGTILSVMDELGYDAEWQVIDGSYFLPQKRERVFIIGHLRGKPFKQVFPLGEAKTADNKPYEKSPAYSCIDANYWKGIDNHGARTAIAVSAGYVSESRNGRIVKTDGEPTFTLTTRQSDSAVFDGYNIRTLTPLECERLQGFPDGWTDGVPEQARYRCLGNAVMPPVVEYIADAMAEQWS